MPLLTYSCRTVESFLSVSSIIWQGHVDAVSRAVVVLYAPIRIAFRSLVLLCVKAWDGWWKPCSEYRLLQLILYSLERWVLFSVQTLGLVTRCVTNLPFHQPHLTQRGYLGAVYEYVATFLECWFPSYINIEGPFVSFWAVDSRIDTAAFIKSICCRSVCGICPGVMYFCISLAQSVCLSNVAADSGSYCRITLKGEVPAVLRICVLYAYVSSFR